MTEIKKMIDDAKNLKALEALKKVQDQLQTEIANEDDIFSVYAFNIAIHIVREVMEDYKID